MEDPIFDKVLEFNPKSFPLMINRHDLLLNEVKTCLINIDKHQKLNYVIVSLSGGVDSISLMHCLFQLQSEFNYKIIAGHVNYNNREETHIEQKFLERWCDIFNITIHVLNITQFKRGITNRKDYEDQTKILRYDFYKELLLKYPSCGIFIGHHSNDLAENVFTNIMNGRDILDLSVIVKTSTVLQVPIIRPFVNIYKKNIFDFAHKHYIPYFIDTTPDWSNRGILRRVIFEQLGKHYGDSFQNNLVRIGNMSEDWNQIIKDKIITPFWNKILFNSYGAVFDISEYSNYPLCFWKTILREIHHHMSLPQPSNKSILNFINTLNNGKKEGFISLKHNTLCFYSNNIYLIYKKILLPSIHDVNFLKETVQKTFIVK